MTAWSGFYDHVATHLKGATLPLISNEVKNAAIEFCERAPVWTEAFTPISVNGATDYALATAVADTVLVRATEVWFEGKELVHKSPGELAVLYDRWVTKTVTNPVKPEFWTQLTFDRLRPVPTPTDTIASALTGLAQVKPTATATTIPDAVFQQWYMGISHGALSRLFLMPAKPWTNGELGVFHGKAFAAAIEAATMKVMG